MSKNYVGQKFGMLKVLKKERRMTNSGRMQTFYYCKCDCGNEKWMRDGVLVRSTGCGCLRGKSGKTNIHKALKTLKEDYFVDGTSILLLKNKKLIKSNTSGVRGVYWNKSAKKWRAGITFKKKAYFLGLYDTIEEAKQARENAEKELFDKFLEQNENKEGK